MFIDSIRIYLKQLEYMQSYYLNPLGYFVFTEESIKIPFSNLTMESLFAPNDTIQ